MTTNPSLSPGIPKEKPILFEIGNSEKQLWTLIHSKGLLHSDSQDMYRKVRSSYERTILDNHTHSELQDVEYSLWKLHYKHIDEFRKRINKCSGNVENKKTEMLQDGVVQINNDSHLKAFKSFLSEATEFYQALTVKLRKSYGVPEEEALFYRKGWVSTCIEPEVMLKCQYLCHRCLVCMGDLARYKQQYESLDIQNQNWSVPATYYLEAARIWPDSGNPQNQLAVLATYIGDDFIALYHCVRSLAVKEPFPDAWDNLILLLEKNRSSHLQYVSREVCFDFFNPSARIGKANKALPNDNSSNCSKFEGESNHLTDTKLWSLMVRTISFFFITSSLEEIPAALASTIGLLDKMMDLEDIELKTMLESYVKMDLTRKGPFRALQVVCILIFSLKNLIDKHEQNESKNKNDPQQLVLIQLALATAFCLMGRFVERCLQSTPLNYCLLLPSVLVFVEWYASNLDATKVYETDQKSTRAVSYFFGVFIELLNQLNDYRKETRKLLHSTPLWEDYELRGFVPVVRSHFSLDFSGSWEHIENFESGIDLRTQRLSEAATKIASRFNNLQKWIICDELGRKFYLARSDEDHEKKETEYVVHSNDNNTREEESNQKTHKDISEHGKRMTLDNPSSSSSSNVKSFVVEEEEEEEEILFRPLTRYNSAPSYPSISSGQQISPKVDKDSQSLPSDDCLRRTTSLLMSNKSPKQQEPSMKESNSNAHTYSVGPISAGPPSLSAWVLDRGSLSINRDKETNVLSDQRLQPIEEVASYFSGLSINKTENSVDESSNFSSSCMYSAPTPSAPLLPDNASWLSPALLPYNTPPVSGYSDWSCTYGPHGYDPIPTYSAYSNGYPPPPGRMASSEWLHRYGESYKPEQLNYPMQPTHLSYPGNHENLLHHDTYRFNQFDQWGNLLSSNHYTYIEQPGFPYPYAFGAGEHMSNNFQRPSPYGCGAVTDLRNGQQ